jgi:hypothetical protein
MRHGFAAAALAALAVALPAPAAAQPETAEIVRNLARVMAESHPPQVEDYTLTLVYREMRMPVYVRREGDEWEVSTPEDAPLGDFASMAVFWPELATIAAEDGSAELDEARYLRRDQVEGRETHVLTADLNGDGRSEDIEAAEIFVDARTHQVLRMHVAGTLPPDSDDGEGFGGIAGGRMELTIDMLDHHETDGLVIPGRVRLRMRMEMPEMEASERAQMRMGIALARAELENSDEPEAREMLAMIDLFASILTGEEMDIPMTVEDVRVNTGAPEWMD